MQSASLKAERSCDKIWALGKTSLDEFACPPTQHHFHHYPRRRPFPRKSRVYDDEMGQLRPPAALLVAKARAYMFMWEF